MGVLAAMAAAAAPAAAAPPGLAEALRTSGWSGPDPVELSFRAGGRRLAVRKIVSVRGRVTVLAVAGGRRATLRVARRARSAVALEAALGGAGSVSLSFRAVRGERFYGFGERSNAVAQRATEVENYVSDGPFSKESLPIVKRHDPGRRDTAPRRRDLLPGSVAAVGARLRRPDRQRRDQHVQAARRVAADAGASTVRAPRLNLRLFRGPTAGAGARALQRRDGPPAGPAAPWAFGPWLQTGQPNAPPLADEVA